MPKYKPVKGYPDLRRDEKSGRLYLRMYSKATGAIYRSLGADVLTAQTRQLMEQVKRDFYLLDPKHKAQTFAEIADECFQVRIEPHDRDSTKREARYIYDQLIGSFGHLHPTDFTDRAWLTQLEMWREAPDCKRSDWSLVRTYAKQIDRYAFQKGYKGFRCDLSIPKHTPREGRVLDRHEFDLLTFAARTGLYRQKERQYVPLFLMCGWHMGMRRGEILGLEKDRVDLTRGKILLRAEDTKTGSRKKRGREFAIAPVVMPAMARHLDGCDRWLFPNPRGTAPMHDLRGSIAKLIEITGIDFRPHDLRHSFLTRKLLVERVDPMSVAVYAGVSLEVIQDRYLHATVDDTRHVVERG